MPAKRALVVDDSKAARVALRQLLTNYDLEVDFAKSGEEALEFLTHSLVDVIFMDHTMPGMDGLQAVAEIKANPRTATIPVMMYTAKEGEVYVGQARALGAVGIIPKEVQPGVLYTMLKDLGLVTERRVDEAEPTEENEPEDARPDHLGEIDRALDQLALGESLKADVVHLLEDHHLRLREDLLRSQHDIAHQVVAELLTSDAQVAAAEEPAPTTERRYSQRMLMVLALVLLVPAMLFAMLFNRARDERDVALAELASLDTEFSEQLSAAEEVTTSLLKNMNTERSTRSSSHLQALQWALNHNNHLSVHEIPLDRRRVETLDVLLRHLQRERFSGTVRLTTHLGRFCLAERDNGLLELAPGDASIESCSVLGHPLDSVSLPAGHQTAAFANFMNQLSITGNSSIQIEVVTNDRQDSRQLVDFPPNVTDAGAWNAVARLNNRVEFELLPD